MGVAVQKIKDPESEARELDRVLKAVGNALRLSVQRPGKTGMTFSQLKAKSVKKAR
jgi:hypothetical protein